MGDSRRYPVALLCMALAACASKPAAPPPPPPAPVVPAPATKPEPPKAAPVKRKRKAEPAAPRPSVADTKTISFAGDVYGMKYQGILSGESVRQYYAGGETATHWTRLIELRVYPTAGKGISAADYAARVAKSAQAANPYAEYTLQANKAEGTATLYFTTWNEATLQAHYTEFDAFKFIPSVKDGDIVGFHYIEKLYTDLKASTEDNRKKTEAEKARVLLELARVPLYQG